MHILLYLSKLIWLKVLSHHARKGQVLNSRIQTPYHPEQLTSKLRNFFCKGEYSPKWRCIFSSARSNVVMWLTAQMKAYGLPTKVLNLIYEKSLLQITFQIRMWPIIIPLGMFFVSWDEKGNLKNPKWSTEQVYLKCKWPYHCGNFWLQMAPFQRSPFKFRIISYPNKWLVWFELLGLAQVQIKQIGLQLSLVVKKFVKRSF